MCRWRSRWGTFSITSSHAVPPGSVQRRGWLDVSQSRLAVLQFFANRANYGMVYRQYRLSPYPPFERAHSVLPVAGSPEKCTRIAGGQDNLAASDGDLSLSAFEGLGCRVPAHDSASRDLAAGDVSSAHKALRSRSRRRPRIRSRGVMECWSAAPRLEMLKARQNRSCDLSEELADLILARLRCKRLFLRTFSASASF